MEPMLPNPTPEIPQPQSQVGETGDNSGIERSAPSPAEQLGAPTVATTATQDDSTQATSVVSDTNDPALQASAPQTDNPSLADDVDVIEKEWVNKAKKIVETTKSDPYSQEKEVSKLQAEYLMKRYGKQIKVSE